ncbi:hypothetical protein KOF26_11650 [Sphingomonas sp. XMGL2]|uniref:Uncharacterized protein n=2 Tax=Sphingomonas quercus TaxID=2842451 RepID=A0ABS6BJP6_9SPHN|nr:hypothetical protein [Sphingomonas quercus]
MAYMDFNAAYAAPALVAPAPQAEEVLERTGFSPLEWKVIALAHRDRLSSLAEPGPLSRALGSVFGLGTSSRLADPKLEAVRRLAVHAWHKGYALPVSELEAFKAEGFTIAQAETLLASVGTARATRTAPRRERLA